MAVKICRKCFVRLGPYKGSVSGTVTPWNTIVNGLAGVVPEVIVDRQACTALSLPDNIKAIHNTITIRYMQSIPFIGRKNIGILQPYLYVSHFDDFDVFLKSAFDYSEVGVRYSL